MSKPLAERLRPKTLDEYIGQRHLVGEGAVLRRMIEGGRLSSFILWGPPGVGKTTLAGIVASQLKIPFFTLSAVTSGVKDVREVIEKAEKSRFFGQGPSPILFIDEIHRFSKSQQDSLLGAVERGTVTLIGATTENPSFEVIRPLLSRCQVYTLEPLNTSDLMTLINRAISTDQELKQLHIVPKETAALMRYSGGDARKLLNILELIVEQYSPDTNSSEETETDEGTPQLHNSTTPQLHRSASPLGSSENSTTPQLVITDALVTQCLQQSPLAYDKQGEMHYDIISAFIKSIRGSDPDAALYWLARMIEGGEDPQFIARRLVISASEDVGLANPNALLLANAAFDAVMKIGWPEGRIPLAEATVYLAASPKSNSAYMGINSALETVRQTGNLPVPLHLRNAPTQLMKELGYADGYKYAHDFPGHFIRQQYLPDALISRSFWQPQHTSQQETKLQQHMAACWGDRYNNP